MNIRTKGMGILRSGNLQNTVRHCNNYELVIKSRGNAAVTTILRVDAHQRVKRGGPGGTGL